MLQSWRMLQTSRARWSWMWELAAAYSPSLLPRWACCTCAALCQSQQVGCAPGLAGSPVLSHFALGLALCAFLLPEHVPDSL